MTCKLCGRNLKDLNLKLYLHLSRSHHHPTCTHVEDYLKMFPEQREEYLSEKCFSWNKGLTKETSESVRVGAEKVKKFTNKPEVRLQRSERLKNRYKNGDILSPENRARVVKIGNEAWVKKVKSSDIETRRNILRHFVDAGNEAQKERRKDLTPEDYNRLYPWSLGKARYYDCDNCGKRMIAWFGGKPRSKKRFCDSKCYRNYLAKHPFYVLSSACIRYYSIKMEMEFMLRSRLEQWISIILDESSNVESWAVCPFYIDYEYEGVPRKYFPDFLINGKIILEVKSDWIYEFQIKKNICKFRAAEKYCKEHGFEFWYWQFNGNHSFKKVKADARVRKYFMG